MPKRPPTDPPEEPEDPPVSDSDASFLEYIQDKRDSEDDAFHRHRREYEFGRDSRFDEDDRHDEED